MEQWPSGQGADLPNQRSQVQNHKVAEKLPQLSSFKGQSNEYQGFLGTWWLKVLIVTLLPSDNLTISIKWSTKTNEH